MKTAVTIINTEQTGMDNYKDVFITKVFEDHNTLLEIKTWIKSVGKIKSVEAEDISLASVTISDVDK